MQGRELGIHMLRRLGRQALYAIAQRRNIRGHGGMSEDELARSVYQSFEE